MSVTGSLSSGRDLPSSVYDWTFQEHKAFEVALAANFNRPDRWERVAEVIPGKTAQDVQQYFLQLEEDLRRIDSGLVPMPSFVPPPPSVSGKGGRRATMPLSASAMVEAPSQTGPSAKKNKVDAGSGDKRKGVPWTEEEHKLFLLGLAKFGKGDWRSIARNYVVSRTPTQVASHAQKYFIRLNSTNKKDKRRASIHDITSATITQEMTGGFAAMPPLLEEGPTMHDDRMIMAGTR